MNDQASVAELKRKVQSFCEARDWDQFHNPKDLAIGIVTEASELLEEFRFRSESEGESLMDAAESHQRIEGELADVLFFLLRFAQMFDIDLPSVLKRKLEENERRYPVEKARGKNLKYTDL